MDAKEKKRLYMREYHSRPEVKERKKQRDKEYRERNRETALARSKKWYLENRDTAKLRINKHQKIVREQRRLEAIEKLGGQCMDCENSNYIVLQFHHRPGEIKVGEVTALATSEEKFWIEVSKCDLICANCHLIRHSEGR